MMLSSVAGRVMQIAMSDRFDENNPELSLGTLVVNTDYLRKILENAESFNHNSLTQVLLKNCKSDNFRVYNYNGFVASVSSFLDYYKYSMELVSCDSARESLLGNKEAPIFTRVNNSAPTIYKSNAKIDNCMIADECVIDGTVINSVVFRDVIIEKGAVVKNCVLFHGTRVCKNAELNSIVTDKDVTITEGVKLSGNENMPFYVQKRRKV
jgi:glucose-1-phosphate adenylyltransferase